MSSSTFFVSVPEEFVSEPGLSSAASADGLAASQGSNGGVGDVSHHVAVLANSMLSELQRLTNLYCIDPDEMSSLARLITSSLEELDVLVTENAAIEAAANQAKADLEHVVKKLTSEQDLRQSSERKQWEIQDFADHERRQIKSQLEQMKMSNAQLQERLKSKTNAAQALQDDLEEVRKRQAEERQSHLEAIKRYMTERDSTSVANTGRSMSNAAGFAPNGSLRRRASIRSARSKRSSTMSPASGHATPDHVKSPLPPELAEETLVPASEEAQLGAAELRRLCRSETVSESSGDWEAAMGMGSGKSSGDVSLQSELAMLDPGPGGNDNVQREQPLNAALGGSADASPTPGEQEGLPTGILSDDDVDAVIDDVNQLAKDAAEVDMQRAQLAKENSELKTLIDDLTSAKGDLQQLVASLQTNKDHLEAEARALREGISRLKDEAATASRTAVVPDFSVQLRKENERLMKLYSFYKEKCLGLQEDLARQNEPLDSQGGLRRLFARLLSGLRRRGNPEKAKLTTPPPSVSPLSKSPSPDGSNSSADLSASLQHRHQGSISSDDSASIDSRTPLVTQTPPCNASTSKRSPLLARHDGGQSSSGSSRSPNLKRLSQAGSTVVNKAKTLSITYRTRRQSSSGISIAFDDEEKPVVTNTGIYSPCGDWVIGSDGMRLMESENRSLPSCSSQAALFSPEGSKIQCATVSTCQGSPSTLDAPLIDFSSTCDDAPGMGTASAAGLISSTPLCQQMWVCTKQMGAACQIEILDVIGTGSLRHTGTILTMDVSTRTDTVLTSEFVPEFDTSNNATPLFISPVRRASSAGAATGSDAAATLDVSSTTVSGSIPTVWLGTDSDDGHVLIYHARPGLGLGEKLQECHFQHGAVTCIRYAFQRVFVGFSNGLVLGFNRQQGTPCGWNMVASDEDSLKLADLSAPMTNNRQLNDITCMEAVETLLWCSCGTYIFSVDPVALTVVSCAKTNSRHPISHMISLACGVVLATAHSSKLQFYHMTSLQVLQEFETAPLQDVADTSSQSRASGKLSAVTSLTISDNNLWVGTGTGVLLRLPISTVLDKSSLQMTLGTPACSYDTACVSQWSHWSAVRCLLTAQCKRPANILEDSTDGGTDPASSSTDTALGSHSVVFSGGLGSLDFRNASATELKSRSRFTSFSAARAARGKSFSTVEPLKPTATAAPMFHQLLVWM